MEKKILTDGDLLRELIERINKRAENKDGERAYVFGCFYEFDGLDVKDLKNPIFDSKN